MGILKLLLVGICTGIGFAAGISFFGALSSTIQLAVKWMLERRARACSRPDQDTGE